MRRWGVALLGLFGLALFSLVFSLLAARDHWPRLRPGALHDTDLAAGLVGGVALLVLLLRNGRGRRESGARNPEKDADETSAPPRL